MPYSHVPQARCPACDGIGWIEQIHPSETMARVVPCPARCAQGALMAYSLPPAETGWYLHGPAQGLPEERGPRPPVQAARKASTALP